MLSIGIKQYKTSNKSLRQRQMERITPKKKSQSYERKSMSLPKKTFLEAKFSNERLNDALKVSQISASFSHKSPEAKHQKTFSVNFQTKFDKTQHSRLSFVDFVTTKNAFRKILKLNTMKGQKSIDNKTMIWQKSPKAKVQKPIMTQIDEYTSQIRKCMELSTKQAMRKSYHQKFQKTRLIFQQEEKMKKIDKINKIYERKNATFNKLNRSEDIKELRKARQQSIAQKWARRYEKHEIYQISENGQEYERRLNHTLDLLYPPAIIISRYLTKVVEMLYQSIKNFKLPRDNISIQFFSPSFDDSCVVVYTDSNNSLRLVHIGKEGKNLFERPIEKGCDSFAMTTDQSMVFLQLNKSRVTQINFRDQSTISFPHTFVFSESGSKKLAFFSQSKLLCVRQHGSQTDNTLKLTYYSYPINQHTKSAVVYESKQRQWEYGNKLRKGDNKSQIIWFKVRQNSCLQFHTFQVEGSHGSHKVYTIKDASFSLLQNRSYLAIHDIWQIKQQQFFVACTSPLLYRSRTRPEILHVTNNSIRLITDTLDIPASTYLDTRINLGSFSMLLFILPQDEFDESQTIAIHLDHMSLDVIKTKPRDQNTEATSMQLDFDHSTYMTLVIKQEKESQTISIRFTKVMHPKEVALHFILHINEDFDDDLLQDSLELLDLI